MAVRGSKLGVCIVIHQLPTDIETLDNGKIRFEVDCGWRIVVITQTQESLPPN